MALEIKPAPVLKGQAADRFAKIVEENQHKRITPEKKAEMTKMVEIALKKARI